MRENEYELKNGADSLPEDDLLLEAFQPRRKPFDWAQEAQPAPAVPGEPSAPEEGGTTFQPRRRPITEYDLPVAGEPARPAAPPVEPYLPTAPQGWFGADEPSAPGAPSAPEEDEDYEISVFEPVSEEYAAEFGTPDLAQAESLPWPGDAAAGAQPGAGWVPDAGSADPFAARETSAAPGHADTAAPGEPQPALWSEFDARLTPADENDPFAAPAGGGDAGPLGGGFSAPVGGQGSDAPFAAETALAAPAWGAGEGSAEPVGEASDGSFPAWDAAPAAAEAPTAPAAPAASEAGSADMSWLFDLSAMTPVTEQDAAPVAFTAEQRAGLEWLFSGTPQGGGMPAAAAPQPQPERDAAAGAISAETERAPVPPVQEPAAPQAASVPPAAAPAASAARETAVPGADAPTAQPAAVQAAPWQAPSAVPGTAPGSAGAGLSGSAAAAPSAPQTARPNTSSAAPWETTAAVPAPAASPVPPAAQSAPVPTPAAAPAEQAAAAGRVPNGRTVLISGGDRGIGAAAARAFWQAGYKVAILYHTNEAAARALVNGLGCDCCAVRCDVASYEACAAAFRVVERSFGPVDVLVSNAGIAQQKLFTDITPAEWQRMLDVNLTGAFNLCQAALPGMIRRKWGRILTVSSMWGQTGGSCEVHYSAAKAGLIGLTKALAKEEGPSGITVNCVAPGVIETDMMAGFSAQDKAALAEETPVGRLGTPAEVAALLVYLAGEQTAFITGQVFGVNGGLVI